MYVVLNKTINLQISIALTNRAMQFLLIQLLRFFLTQYIIYPINNIVLNACKIAVYYPFT